MVNYSISLETLEVFLLILVRIASFVFIAPFFGQNGFPNRVQIGLSVVVSLLLFYTLPHTAVSYETVFGFSAALLKETACGLMIGFSANICTYVIQFSGHMIDMDIGLSMATQLDPMTNQQVSLTGVLYEYLIILLLVVSDMHRFIFRALCDAYELIPIGGITFEWDHLMTSIVSFMADFLILGFRIMLPIFACVLILNVVLGILAKVAPQMNMFVVGMQMKILVGYIILFLTLGLLPVYADMMYQEIKKLMVMFMKGMY